MDGSNSSYLCHWAEVDQYVTDLEVAELGLALQMAGRDFRFEHHVGTVDAEVVAWRQTTEFLAGALAIEHGD